MSGALTQIKRVYLALPFGSSIGASAKILYCCTRGFALSSSFTNWNELLPSEVARQDHDADEVGCCGRSRPARTPDRCRSRTRRRPACSWSNGPACRCGCRRRAGSGCPAPVLVQEGAAVRRKRHAVAAQQKIALGNGRKLRGELLQRAHARPARRTAGRAGGRKLVAPDGDAVLAGLHRRGLVAVPRLAVVQPLAADRHDAMHDKDHARQCRQRNVRRAAGNGVLEQAQHGMH